MKHKGEITTFEAFRSTYDGLHFSSKNWFIWSIKKGGD